MEKVISMHCQLKGVGQADMLTVLYFHTSSFNSKAQIGNVKAALSLKTGHIWSD